MQCCIGLGGNLGAVGETFARAIGELRNLGHCIHAVSSIYQTAPMGANAGDSYSNAALVMETSRAPHELLDELQQVESTLGRRRGIHWGPRTVDLDMLLIDDLVIRDDRLEVPHPGVAYRRFVLDPLSEIAPTWRHPMAGLMVADIRAALMPRPLGVSVDVDGCRFPEILELLQQFASVGLLTIVSDKSAGPTLTLTSEGSFSLGLPSLPNHLTIDSHDDAKLRAVFTAMLDEPHLIGSIPESP